MTLLVPIVEGHGEVEALPPLLHRIAGDETPGSTIRVNQPIRVKAGSFLNDESYFARHVQLAAAKARQSSGQVLILLDCEDDCPASVGPHLLERARAVAGDVPLRVFLAYREFETWFLVAAQSLRSVETLPADLDPPPDPEAIRDAKGWLSERMTTAYDPVVHQAALARHMRIDLAAESRSFRRLRDHVRSLAS